MRIVINHRGSYKSETFNDVAEFDSVGGAYTLTDFEGRPIASFNIEKVFFHVYLSDYEKYGKDFEGERAELEEGM